MDVPSSGASRESQETSETGSCGDCKRILWLPNPRSQYSRKIRLIEKSWVQDEGVAIWLTRSQTSGTGPSASCGYCCPLCPSGGGYTGKIRLIEPQGENGHIRHVADDPSSGTSRESQAKFRDGTVWGL